MCLSSELSSSETPQLLTQINFAIRFSRKVLNSNPGCFGFLSFSFIKQALSRSDLNMNVRESEHAAQKIASLWVKIIVMIYFASVRELSYIWR